LLMFDGRIVADGSPHDVLSDESLLRSCRILPTSLLRLNKTMFSLTGKFQRAETLALVQS